MLGGNVRAGGGVFQKGRDVHGGLLVWDMRIIARIGGIVKDSLAREM
jgi:hypothetical protein